MRLTIVRDDNLIIKDGVGYNADLSLFDDLSWIQNYDLKTWGRFHALQWYGDPDEFGEYGEMGESQPYGEVEFKKPVPNLIIKQLGVYNQAIHLWEKSKAAEEKRIADEEAERLRLEQEEEAKIREAYEALERETAAALQEIEDQMQSVEESYLDLEEKMNEVMSSEDEDIAALQLEADLEKLLADL
jgi:hypothetical protein